MAVRLFVSLAGVGLVTLAGYSLIAVHDPRDQFVIRDASDGAVEPTGRDWPMELLNEAGQQYGDKWGDA